MKHVRRLFSCLGLMALAAFAASASAQTEQRVSISMRDALLKTILWELEQKTSLRFMYNQEEVDRAGTVDVDMTGSVGEVLANVLRGTGLTYTVRDGIVVIKQQPQPNMVRISGRVTDSDGRPVAGVTVTAEGTRAGVVTDSDGRYSLTLTQTGGMRFVFSYIGMSTQTVDYTGQQTIDVVMTETSVAIDEVVVNTGYQRFNPRESTAAIQSLKFEELLTPGLQTIDQMLEGHVPGMIFMQNSGQVGAAPRLRVRGTSTILGSQEPVWVVDGIVQENPVNISPEEINSLDFVNLVGNAISGLNPDDIQQIDILKDAAATALYGARAANGVIVVTTKQGRQGPPSVSYSLSGTFMERPHYSDASVNMMNSRERVEFSRELLEKRVLYPQVDNWLGYEKAVLDYWNGTISFEQMQQQVGYYEGLNTDWFDTLMQNSFSTKHTVGLSGGNSNITYYASAGYSDARGAIKDEVNRSYTAQLKLNATFDRWSFRFNLNANVGDRRYTPQDVDVTKYAYQTTRALPSHNPDGSLWYYPRQIESRYFGDFNIINEMRNSSQDIRSTGVTATAGIDYRFSDHLKFTGTASYTANNTTEEVWHGENSFYAAMLRLPDTPSESRNVLPYGGELKYGNTEHRSYTARAQLDLNKPVDSDGRHILNASVGTEVSSTQYYGLKRTFRGYLKERGRKMAEVDPELHPAFARWQTTDPDALGVWSDQLTNKVSGYATVSWIFDNNYTLNVNGRFDTSNRFGSRANDRLSPVWAVSGRWNVKNTVLGDTRWIDELTLRGSFGYQGNMLESVSSRLIIQRGTIDADFGDYTSEVKSFANPDLRWERTSSWNASADFSFFDRFVSGSLSYFYKKTHDAFVRKGISTINGVADWDVNESVLENQGVELALRFTLIDTRRTRPDGFRWSMTTNFGRITNNLSGRNKDQSTTNEVTYEGFLNGSIPIEGRPLNSFYSYQYLGLNPLNGAPMFYGSDQVVYVDNQRVDLLEKYGGMVFRDILKDVMTYSGTRVPTIQGAIQHTFAWRRFSATVNTSYSLGSKIRLLKMYGNVTSEYQTIAPQPTANVRKEFLDRWRQTGDELHTDIPGVISGNDFMNTTDNRMWWTSQKNVDGQDIKFASNIWSMYDNSDLRVVSGDYLKIQSVSVRYSFDEELCRRLKIKSAYVGLSGTNLLTVCSSKLKGQDPATQDGAAPTINMSLRPTYSITLNISF